jgi:hypothetical protein
VALIEPSVIHGATRSQDPLESRAAPEHNRQLPQPRGVAIREDSAVKQTNGHGGEVARRDGALFEGNFFVKRLAFHLEQPDGLAAAQREMVDGRGILHSGEGADPFQQSAEERVLTLRPSVIARQVGCSSLPSRATQTLCPPIAVSENYGSAGLSPPTVRS